MIILNVQISIRDQSKSEEKREGNQKIKNRGETNGSYNNYILSSFVFSC